MAVDSDSSLAVRHDGGALTPSRVSDLIELAIRDGKGPEAVSTIKELVAVAKDLAAIQARNDFNRAFAQFKRDCPKVYRTKVGGDADAAGSKLRWMYAPIEEIAATVDPVMLPLGLSYGWSSEDRGDAVLVTCTVRHVAGHSESAVVSIRKTAPNRAQTVSMADGSAMSMGMRRALSMALGLVTEEIPGGGGEPEARVSEEQARTLDDLLVGIGAPVDSPVRARFLKAYAISHLDELPASKFEAACEQIRAKGKK